MNKVVFSVSFDPDVYSLVRKKAEEEKRSISSLINKILFDYFKKENEEDTKENKEEVPYWHA